MRAQALQHTTPKKNEKTRPTATKPDKKGLLITWETKIFGGPVRGNAHSSELFQNVFGK